MGPVWCQMNGSTLLVAKLASRWGIWNTTVLTPVLHCCFVDSDLSQRPALSFWHQTASSKRISPFLCYNSHNPWIWGLHWGLDFSNLVTRLNVVHNGVVWGFISVGTGPDICFGCGGLSRYWEIKYSNNKLNEGSKYWKADCPRAYRLG